MEIIEAMHGWRSIRAYRPDPVARDVIADLLWRAVQVSTPPASEPPWALGALEGAWRTPGRIAHRARRAGPGPSGRASGCSGARPRSW